MLEASRAFVCVRLATYENAEEGAFVKSLGASRRGNLANTAFVLLAPDGRTRLSKAGRSPRQVYSGAEPQVVRELVAAMTSIAERYPGNDTPAAERLLPYHADLRRGLNVAACDLQPLVVVSIKNEAKRKKVERALASVAWGPTHRGRFAFARVSKRAELASVAGAPKGSAVVVVQPGVYGLTGKVIAKAKTLGAKGLSALLSAALKRFETKEKALDLITDGLDKGIYWKPEIPVTATGRR